MDTASDLSLAASNGDFERVRELILADTGKTVIYEEKKP